MHLSPVFGAALIALKDVGRARGGVLATSPDDNSITVDPYCTEGVTLYAITGNQLLDLSPGIGAALIALKNVGRSGLGVGAGGSALSANHDRIAADPN